MSDPPGCSVSPLTPDVLGARLADVFSVLGPLYRKTTRAVADSQSVEGVSIGVRAVLEYLIATEPQPVPRIAAALALSRQFVQRMVNSAVGQGLAELHPNPAHQRSSLVALTDVGAETIATIKAREHALLLGGGGNLTAADIDACLRVLNALTALIDEANGRTEED